MKESEVTIDTIAAELGEKMAHRLADCFGGQRFHIPSCSETTSTLTKAFGISGARILSKRFGGRVIDVPTGSAHRRREIARLRSQGKSHLAIARQIGCTPRYVCDVLAEQHYLATHSVDR